MKFKNLLRTLMVFLCAVILTLTLLCAKKVHAGSGASFLRVDPSPRTQAMGNSSSVLSFGAQSLGANPANLGAVKYKYEMFTSFANLAQDEQYAHAAFAVNRSVSRRNRIEGLGFSVTQLTVANAEGRDRSGARTNSFGSADRAITLSASSLLGERLRAGATGKLIQSELAGYRSAATFAGDFGLSYDLSSAKTPFSLGLALRNAGPGLRYINQSDPLPSSLNAGLGLGVGRATLIAETIQLLNDHQTHFSSGMEFGFGPLSLRAGLSTLAARSSAKSASPLVENISYGVGLKLANLKFDYALGGRAGGQGGTVHRVALTLTWGAPLDRPRPQIYDLSRSQ